ncbi:guanylate kinase [Paenibacillus sp. FA6]|uniref:guanylate kinase n=1 Tax=Paenibacillus sp. FA6 TaxID=3413029 RepID=UPI003F65814D
MWNWLKSSKTVAIKQELNNSPMEMAHGESSKYKVIVITGTSGSGRKSTARQLSAQLGIPHVIPYTTRTIRPNERDGVHYHFISDGEFQSMADRLAFFQKVHLERGNYGVSKEELFQVLETHQAAIVVVNQEGAQAIRKHFGNGALRIFLYVTKDDIRLRLEREAAPFEVMEEYLRNYTEQVIYKKESEFLLQNIESETTINKIVAFLQDKL